MSLAGEDKQRNGVQIAFDTLERELDAGLASVVIGINAIGGHEVDAQAQADIVACERHCCHFCC